MWLSRIGANVGPKGDRSRIDVREEPGKRCTIGLREACPGRARIRVAGGYPHGEHCNCQQNYNGEHDAPRMEKNGG